MYLPRICANVLQNNCVRAGACLHVTDLGNGAQNMNSVYLSCEAQLLYATKKLHGGTLFFILRRFPSQCTFRSKLQQRYSHDVSRLLPPSHTYIRSGPRQRVQLQLKIVQNYHSKESNRCAIATKVFMCSKSLASPQQSTLVKCGIACFAFDRWPLPLE